jgi:hypothetical protein
LSFLFSVELPTQYSLKVRKTKAKTFYTKVQKSRLVQMNFFGNKYDNLSHLPKSTPAVI